MSLTFDAPMPAVTYAGFTDALLNSSRDAFKALRAEWCEITGHPTADFDSECESRLTGEGCRPANPLDYLRAAQCALMDAHEGELAHADALWIAECNDRANAESSLNFW